MHAFAGAFALVATLAGVATPTALAATYRLDDSSSQVFPPSARWQWAQPPARGNLNRLEMQVRVQVRIDTRAWVGKQGRVYMVLPIDSAGPVTAEWDARGRLMGGRLVSGERALVFSGTVPSAMLEDTLQVRLATDARLTTDRARPMAFHFEFETP
jgi:hypothetical protein